jgi:hypothetical protein
MCLVHRTTENQTSWEMLTSTAPSSLWANSWYLYWPSCPVHLCPMITRLHTVVSKCLRKDIYEDPAAHMRKELDFKYELVQLSKVVQPVLVCGMFHFLGVCPWFALITPCLHLSVVRCSTVMRTSLSIGSRRFVTWVPTKLRESPKRWLKRPGCCSCISEGAVEEKQECSVKDVAISDLYTIPYRWASIGFVIL